MYNPSPLNSPRGLWMAPDIYLTAPIWPEECEEEAVCTTVPTPPEADIPLERADNKTKYRAGEQVYFICKDSRAVLSMIFI